MSEQTQPVYMCPVHPGVELILRLKGGAGYCRVCMSYAQAAGVPEPQLDPWVIANRAAIEAAKTAKAQAREAKRKARAKGAKANKKIKGTVATTQTNRRSKKGREVSR